VDHRRLADRKEMLVGDAGEGAEPRPGAAGENDAFSYPFTVHRLPFTDFSMKQRTLRIIAVQPVTSRLAPSFISRINRIFRMKIINISPLYPDHPVHPVILFRRSGKCLFGNR
jgi:hypothetical protein